MGNKRQRRAQTGAPKGRGKTASERKVNMWYVISAGFLGVFFTVALGIALNSESLAGKFWWGIAAAIFAILGLAALLQYYVIGPRTIVPVPPQPNVVFGDSKLREPLAAGRRTWVDIVLNNTSDVPAEGKFSDVTAKIVVPPFNDNLDYAYRGWGIDFSLAAHQLAAVHFDVPFALNEETVTALNNGQVLLYVYGKGEYWATESPDHKHTLSFCLVYGKDTPGFLGICSKSIKIVDGLPGNITYPNPSPTTMPDKAPSTPPPNIAERPYITVTDVVMKDVAVDKHPTYVVVWKNIGQSPATKASSWIYIVLADKRIDDNPPYAKFSRPPSIVNLGVGEDRASTNTADFTFTAAEMDGIQRGTLWVYVFGWIDYSSNAGKTYKTKFCAEYVPGRRDVIFCPKHNSAD